MPMPKPKDNEEEDDFIERCMGNDTMKEDYPDNKQRLAVCNDIWRKDKEEDSMDTELEERKTLPRHKTPTSDKAWDGPKNEADLKGDGDAAYYKKAFAWVGPDADPETKAAYKFIHHEVSSDGDIGAANIKGCQTGIAVLNGARGGTTIPKEDKKGVWNHLAGHLKDADVEPAELKMEMGEREYRSYPIEIRIDDGDKPKIRGHAAVFDQLSVDLMGFREKIAKGAFTKTIKKSDIRALWNHDSNYVLGRNKSGTLTLAEDDKGLAIEIDPPDTQWARDLQETIRRGDVDQMSFGFLTVRDMWENPEGKGSIRTLLEVELFDVSPVTFPAYPQTDVKVRSVFAEAGLDFDALTSVLTRVQRGIALTNADHDLISASIEALRSYLPEEAEELGEQGTHDDGHAKQGTHNDGYVEQGAHDDGYVERLAMLRRELELIAD